VKEAMLELLAGFGSGGDDAITLASLLAEQAFPDVVGPAVTLLTWE